MIPQAQNFSLNLDLNERNAKILGEAFWNLVKHYDLGRRQQAILLGMNPENRKTLQDYQSKSAIPLEADKFARVGILLGIHKNLRILYPQNRDVVYNWMTTTQELFHHKTPMEFIEGDEANSFLRLMMVRRALDVLRTSF